MSPPPSARNTSRTFTGRSPQRSLPRSTALGFPVGCAGGPELGLLRESFGGDARESLGWSLELGAFGSLGLFGAGCGLPPFLSWPPGLSPFFGADGVDSRSVCCSPCLSIGLAPSGCSSPCWPADPELGRPW